MSENFGFDISNEEAKKDFKPFLNYLVFLLQKPLGEEKAQVIKN